MKKIIYAVMLLLGMSIMATSCNKANTESGGSGSLNGKWIITEITENGKSVECVSERFYLNKYYAVGNNFTFEDGNILIQGPAYKALWPYIYSDGVVRWGEYDYPVKKLNGKEMVWEFGRNDDLTKEEYWYLVTFSKL